MTAKPKQSLSLAIFSLADRPQGVRATELAQFTGQSERAAQKYINRHVRDGLLHIKRGREDGVLTARYFNTIEQRNAYEFPAFAPKVIENKRRGLQKTPGIAALVLEYLANHHGGSAQIAEAIGKHMDSVSCCCVRLHEEGQIGRAAALGPKCRTVWRYFLSQAAADAWAADPANDLASLKKKQAEAKREKEKQRWRERNELRRKAVRKCHSDGDYSAALYRRRLAELLDAQKKAYEGGDPIITDATVHTIAPRPRDRFEPEAPIVGFASLKPGQYPFEAQTCAARAFA